MKHANQLDHSAIQIVTYFAQKNIDKIVSDLFAFCQKCSVRKLKFYAGGENKILYH